MTITVTKIWMDEFRERKSIRVSFSNDRHYEVAIHQPYGVDQVTSALLSMAGMIGRDSNLSPTFKC